MEIRKIKNGIQCIIPLMLILAYMPGIHNNTVAQTTDFSANPTQGYAPLTVVFTDLSTGYYAPVTKQNWTFPGGNPPNMNNVNLGTQVTVVYDTPGTYTVTLSTFEYSYPAGQEIKTDYIIVLDLQFDWGDAPDPYPTLQVDDGARHVIDPPDFFLGAGVDGERDGQPHAEAFGDDSDGWDDDDGVVFTTALQSGNTAGVDVTASLGGGYLNAWIDFTGDGDWGDAGEQIFTDQLLAAGVNSLTFMVPPGSPGGYTYARFRLSFAQGLTFTGHADDGEVEDHRVQLLQADLPDFGDVPDIYRTLLASNGARHSISPDVYLGNSVDGDPDGQPNADALGDDNDGNDDEDGIWISLLSPGNTKAELHVTAHGSGLFYGWIDFNGNGDFADPGERVFSGLPLVDGGQTVFIDIPLGAKLGHTYARFRYQQELNPNLQSFGLGEAGEVEDYRLSFVLDFGDLPDSYGTLLASDGARHPISPGPAGALGMPTLGSSNQFIDGELDGQPSWDARGDDDNGSDDEDGVVIPLLVPGETATLTVTLMNTFSSMVDPHPEPYLHGWIDFNHDGDFIDPNEHVFKGLHLDEGIYALDVDVPPNAVEVFTYARFRYSFDRSLGPDKMGGLGEVEDYCVLISSKPFDFGDAPDETVGPMYPTLLVNNGALHTLIEGWHLGVGIDPEPDGQPDEEASEDDTHVLDDEDGVVFNTDPLIRGETGHITVTAAFPPKDGFLSAWVDFNGDGDWEDPGEQIYHLEPLNVGSNDLHFQVPDVAVTDKVYARFRLYVDFPFDHFKGWGGGGEVEDYRIEIAAPQEPDPEPETNKLKWRQLPLNNRNSAYPDSYWGWDETSIVTHRIAADDWFCGDAGPVTKIRWWGSYDGWSDPSPPEDTPESFVITIWTNNPTDPAQRSGLTDAVVWQQTISRNQTHETVAGSDYVAVVMTNPDTCFQYEYTIPDTEWFYQSGDSAVYWLTIAAKYTGSVPTQHRWGWLTRSRYFGASAISILNPSEPTVGSVYQSADLIMQGGWDMAFMFFSSQAGHAYDYGDAPDPDYPTLLSGNGAHHMIWPGVFLGAAVDEEANGQSDSEAFSDDNNGDDDEDGIVFNSDVVPGSMAYINVTASTDGVLNGWIDFNVDGDWNDTDEQVLTDRAVLSGLNNLAFNIPQNVTIEKTIARFRFGLVNGLTPYGLDIGGEVEDYEVILSLPPRFWADTDGDKDTDIIDIQLAAAHWNSQVGYHPNYDSRYDLDNGGVGDGDIDIVDVQLVAARWNEPIPPAAGMGKALASSFSGGTSLTLRWAKTGGSPVIELLADNAADLAGFEMDLVSRSGMPQIVSVEPGSFFTVSENKTIILGPQVSDSGDRVAMGIVSYGSTSRHQSSGYLVKIMLAEASEPLTPEGLQIVDRYGNPMEIASLVNELGDNQAMPRRFELEQSYPNPFNPETTIKFSMPHAGEVRLTVYDINGREVCTLVKGQWAAGFHSVIWNGRDRHGQRVATGMYFYRIDFKPTGGQKKRYMEVKKMILMK